MVELIYKQAARLMLSTYQDISRIKRNYSKFLNQFMKSFSYFAKPLNRSFTKWISLQKIYKCCSNSSFAAVFGPASARSCKIGVVGNNLLVGWLVGNAVFSKTALRIFLIFCMKLGDYKGRKVTARFLKKNLDLDIFAKTTPN